MSADELRGEGEICEDTHRQVHPAAAIAWRGCDVRGCSAASGMRDRLEAIAAPGMTTATVAKSVQACRDKIQVTPRRGVTSRAQRAKRKFLRK